MNWIRIDVGMPSDPKLQKLASALKVPKAHAIGLVVATLCHFPDHARDGDVSVLDDATLEDWAGWRGKEGAFGTAFRAILCTSDGVVSGWEKHNGAAVRKSDRDTERQARYRRGKRETPASGSPPVAPPVTRDTGRDATRDNPRNNPRNVAPPVTHDVHRDGTGRNYSSSVNGEDLPQREVVVQRREASAAADCAQSPRAGRAGSAAAAARSLGVVA